MESFSGFRNTDTKKKTSRSEFIANRSEFIAHSHLLETISPKPVSDVIEKYKYQLTQSNANISMLENLIKDEYDSIKDMNLSEDEIKTELEYKLKQLLPRKS